MRQKIYILASSASGLYTLHNLFEDRQYGFQSLAELKAYLSPKLAEAVHYNLILGKCNTSASATCCRSLATKPDASTYLQKLRLWLQLRFVVRNARGKTLDLYDLVASFHWVRWFLRKSTSAAAHNYRQRNVRFYADYVYRASPIPGRGWRGGPSSRGGKYRHLFEDQRHIADDGEVAGRFSKSDVYDLYDNSSRCVQRSWKSQHKGRKSWDTPTQAGRPSKAIPLSRHRLMW